MAVRLARADSWSVVLVFRATSPRSDPRLAVWPFRQWVAFQIYSAECSWSACVVVVIVLVWLSTGISSVRELHLLGFA